MGASEGEPLTLSRPVSSGGRWRRIACLLQEELDGLHFRLRIANLLLFFLPPYVCSRLRTAVYRLIGVRVGPRSLILGSMNLFGPGPIFSRLQIGADCLLNTPLDIDLNSTVKIGDRVWVGHHVVMITMDHEIGSAQRRCGASAPKPIVIEDGAWIGARATILPGVTIGAGAVVGASSVVTKHVPPNCLVAGVPARVIRELEPPAVSGI